MMGEEDRNPVDLLADEFAARLRSGESPSVQEYVARYPELADEIQELLPGVALLEQLSEKQESEASFAHRPKQDSLPPGHRFGDIEIVREIGRGGMGVVYEAYQHSLNRSVAVKAITGSAVHSPNQAARFQREAQAAAQLHHTNIVPVFGVGEQDGTSYYVMQLINGMGLDAILTELSRNHRSRPPRPSGRARGSELLSARDLASVLISGRLSESAFRGGAKSRSGRLERDQDATQPFNEDAPPEVQSALEYRAESRTDDRTGQLGEGDTPKTFVRSSLELRDHSSAADVRSSMVLRDELSGGEAFAAADGEHPGSAAARPLPTFLGPRYWRNIARMSLQVASGLQYAHSQGTLHRDIKPANILLDTEGTAWIADFGLAKLLEQNDMTKTGDVVGTLRYMSPEQLRGEADGRSDLYSLGLTLYELLTLRPVHDETDRQKLIALKLTPHDPPHPRKLHPGIPRDLETIVLKCLAWEPSGRYQTAGALVTDLQAYLEDRPIQARRISSTERFWRWCKRNPAIAGLSTTVLALLLLIASLAGVGYVRAQKRADLMADLKDDADRERAKTEQIADLQWDALNRIYATFVPERFAGPVEASVDTGDSEEESGLATESTATVLSPQTAAMLEVLVTSFDRVTAIRGADARYLDETAKAYRKVGDLHVRLGQYDAAVDSFGRAIDRYQELEKLQGFNAQTMVLIARLYNGLGVAQQHLGRPSEAREALALSITLLTSPKLDRKDPAVRAEIAATHYLMGRRPPSGSPPPRPRDDEQDADRRITNSTEAEPSSNDPRPSSDDVADAGPGVPPPAESGQARGEGRDAQRGRNRGRGERRRGWDFSANRQHLETAVSILQPLVDEYPVVAEYRFLLALCHIELSHPWIQPEGASGDAMLSRSIDILDQLVNEHPEVPDYVYQLSEAYEQQYYRWRSGFRPLFLQQYSSSSERSGDDQGADASGLQSAEEDLQRAVQLSARLIRRQPNVPRYAEGHLSLLFNLADVKVAQGDFQEARKLLDEAALQRQAFRDRFPEADDGRGLRGTYNELLTARILLELGKPEDAEGVLREVVARVDQSDQGESRRFDPFRSMILRPAYLMMAEAYEVQDDLEAAEDARRKADSLTSGSSRRSRGGTSDRDGTN